LESLARFWLSWFFTFNLTWIPGQKSCRFQFRTKISVDFQEGTRNTKTKRFGLTCQTTTIKINFDVILTGDFTKMQRLLNNILQRSYREVFV